MNYSILMAIYKQDQIEYIRKSIRSMLSQTLLTNDFIIVKDGPISEAMQAAIDEETRAYSKIVRQIQLPENIGLGLALNKGLKYCKNDIVARMDADDISVPNRCEVQLSAFKKDHLLDIIGSSVDEFVGDPTNIVSRRVVPESHEDIVKYMRFRDPFNHPTVMYRKNRVQSVGGYSDLRKNQDTDLWIRMIEAGYRTKNIKDSLLYFRFDEKTYMRRKNWQNTKLIIKIRYKSYKRGFNTLFDFLGIMTAQVLIYIMPISFQKFIYNSFLREG